MLRGLRSGFFHVDDLTAARDWYAGLLGREPYFDEPFYVGFDVEGYELGIVPGGGAGVGGGYPSWAVDDPAAFVVRAVELGATERDAPTDVGDGIVTASVLDPFGNVLSVIFNPHFAPLLTFAGATDISESRIEISCDVPVSPLEAWGLWSSSVGLASWWTAHSKIDLRPGGAYEVYFDAGSAPGFRGADGCRVLSFLPGRMISFTWNAPQIFATRPWHTFVVVTFDSHESGTLVTLSHLGWPVSGLETAGSDWPETYEYFSTAWRSVVDLFKDHFA